MTDHPVLIPTSEGPVGGVVTEPPGERRAKLVLMPGFGRPARSGTNAFWTRTARALAELGIVVLRCDYSREGETLPIGEGGSGMAWKRELDLRLLRQVLPWFSERAGDVPLLLAGACAGTRFAVYLAAEDPAAVAGLFLVVLDPRPVVDEGSRGPGVGEHGAVDPQVVDDLRSILAHAPVWALAGERDAPDVPELIRRLGPTENPLELEVVPGSVLHFLDQPDLQEQAGTRLLARVRRALAPVAGATS